MQFSKKEIQGNSPEQMRRKVELFCTDPLNPKTVAISDQDRLEYHQGLLPVSDE